MFGKKTRLALAVPAIMSTGAVWAQDEVIELDTLQIEERTLDTNPYAEQGAPYKAKISGDARHVKPLAETPQTISVLTQTQIEESGDTDLRDVLAAQPGITLGTGENGNAFGDRYVIRGHEARSDVFIDSLRDPGMTSRESFAVEQIEISKGPSSTFAGRGSSGGAVNSITKQASSEYDFTKVKVGLGTDEYQRYSLDANQRINGDLALRANVLYADKDIPDRGPASEERIGVALSAAWQASDKLKLIGDYYYLDANDKPDLGSYIDRDSGKPNNDMPVYLQGEDFLNSTVNVFTLRGEYQLDNGMTLANASRYGSTENGYVVTGAGKSTRDVSDSVAPGADTITLSTHQGWQEVDYFINMTSLYFDTDIADMKHQFLLGLEYSDINVQNGNYSVTNNGATNCTVSGFRGVSPGYCITDGSGNTVAGINDLMDRDIHKDDADSDYSVETISLSLMDTVDITDRFSVFAGVRADYFEYANKVAAWDSDETTKWAYNDTLWNGHVGAVYDLTETGNVYVTYSTATNINGGESDVGGSCGYGGLCGDVSIVGDSEPEDVQNIELGTKWNLFDEQLLATLAVFQITKTNVMESESGYDYVTNGFLNSGENEVNGVELGLSGNLTDKLSTQLGVAVMDSKVTKSYSADNLDQPLANFAEKSLFAQLRYQLNDKLALGGSVTYSSEVYTGQPDGAANTDFGVPSYTVYDLFAVYEVNDQLALRVNVGNISDETYYLTAYRSGSFAYLGEARNAQLTMSYEF
tara:strand:- start:7377 stop:9641 length:2265 start_codon:yes stop_codon:yes gene_type:complete